MCSTVYPVQTDVFVKIPSSPVGKEVLLWEILRQHVLTKLKMQNNKIQTMI